MCLLFLFIKLFMPIEMYLWHLNKTLIIVAADVQLMLEFSESAYFVQKQPFALAVTLKICFLIWLWVQQVHNGQDISTDNNCERLSGGDCDSETDIINTRATEGRREGKWGKQKRED